MDLSQIGDIQALPSMRGAASGFPDPDRLGTQQVRTALEAVGVGVWEFDTATGDTRRSGAYDAIYGYIHGFPGIWDAETCLSHVLPEDRAAVEAGWTEAIERAAPMLLTYRIRRASDGAVRWLEARGMPHPGKGLAPLRYVGVLEDVTERHDHDEQQEILLQEMRHRVKNVLANVQSLALHTGRRAASVDDFLRAFGGRLTALARAHDVTGSDGTALAASIRAVVDAAIEPWRKTAQIRVEGCDARISSRQAVALSLALHELATNAVKYGALSVPEGRIELALRPSAEGRLAAIWRERGGPPPSKAPGAGFGSRLLLQALPRELGGTVTRRMAAEGVVCALDFPVERPSEG